MKILSVTLASLLTLYLLVGAVLYFTQRKFIYFPPAIYLTPESANLPDFVEISFQDGQGDNLTAWWRKPQEGKPVIMFFHGNGSAVFSNADIYRDLSQQGYGVFGVSYPGYPGASGTPSQTAIVMAAQKQYDWLLAQNIKPEKIIFFGTSLGAGVAAQLSTSRKPSYLIMEAPFKSLLDMVRLRLPLYGFSVLLKDEYRSDIALKQTSMPVLILHGTDDNVIPVKESAKLSEIINGPHERHVIDAGQHTNLWGLGGREIILSALQAY